MKQIEYIVWDLETSGLFPEESKILEIGAMIKYEGEDDLEVKHYMLNHGIEIPEKITEITGITKEIIDAEGKDPKECLEEFLPLLLSAPKNITHNGIRFDIPFLVSNCADILGFDNEKKEEIKQEISSKAYDTAVYFKGKKIGLSQKEDESYVAYANRVMQTRAFGVKFNLGLCVSELKIDTTNITFHRALGDVAMTHKVFQSVCQTQ